MEEEMITDDTQRHTERRVRYRPARETIRPSEYDVDAIGPVEAKAFVRRHHYARTCGSTSHNFALYRRGELAGVAVFGALASMNAHRKVFPTVDTKQGVTLGRLVLTDVVPGNGETYFIVRCFELLRQRGVVGVESCADPQPTVDADGKPTRRGHVGGVYQGSNGSYIGMTNPKTLRVFPDGLVFSNRASGKVVRGETGLDYAEGQLVAYGADPLEPGEDPQTWIDTWRDRLTRSQRHYGNHRYLWALDKRRRAEVLRFPTLPYPKLGGV
jgi:hypothetical protein